MQLQSQSQSQLQLQLVTQLNAPQLQLRYLCGHHRYLAAVAVVLIYFNGELPRIKEPENEFFGHRVKVRALDLGG